MNLLPTRVKVVGTIDDIPHGSWLISPITDTEMLIIGRTRENDLHRILVCVGPNQQKIYTLPQLHRHFGLITPDGQRYRIKYEANDRGDTQSVV